MLGWINSGLKTPILPLLIWLRAIYFVMQGKRGISALELKRVFLANYLAEYTYRFNRRHDPDSLFHRALTACAIAKPKTARALFG
ncbi:MAG: hypothetical protein JNL11_16480 [Bdellovibrionaceae bacterium]|nr:hypothetical protein [Pseudobdellovibrionaceae bacterium]